MTKSEQIEKLVFKLASEDIDDALKITAGIFVGLYVAYIKRIAKDFLVRTVDIDRKNFTLDFLMYLNNNWAKKRFNDF